MEERQVRLTVVLATSFWIAGLVIVISGTLLGMYGMPALGVVVCMVGAVLNVRGFFKSYGDLLRDAFEFGREYERGRGLDRERVTSLR